MKLEFYHKQAIHIFMKFKQCIKNNDDQNTKKFLYSGCSNN